MNQLEFDKKLRKDGAQNIFDGNLTGSTETLFAPGPLTITGDIETGALLIVEGDVTVDGSMFDASLTSTANVTINHSFTGSGKGKIVSAGDVTITAINGQSVVAKGSVTIGVESLNADIRAYERVDAGEARIVGGKTEASNEIIVGTLGSEDGRQTKIYLGNRKKLLQRIQEITAEEKILNDRLPKIVKCIYRWNRIRVEGIVLSAEQETMLAKLRTMRDSFPRQAELFKKEVDHLKGMLRDKIDSTLEIRGAIHENVLVDINGYKEVTSAELHAVRFFMGVHTLQKTPIS
jgi:uncharacterized protein (DUF342 family)